MEGEWWQEDSAVAPTVEGPEWDAASSFLADAPDKSDARSTELQRRPISRLGAAWKLWRSWSRRVPALLRRWAPESKIVVLALEGVLLAVEPTAIGNF